MPDEKQPDSSPDTETEPQPTEFEALTTKQREDFLRTGKLDKPKTEESAPLKTSEAKEPEGAPESEPGKQETKEQKPHKTGEDRKLQLAAEIQDLLTQRRQLRDEVGRLKQGEAAPETPAPKPVQAKTDDKAPKRPKLDDFESLDAYEEARDVYYNELSAYNARKLVAEERAAAQKADEEKKIAEANKETQKTWTERCKSAAQTKEDFAERAFRPELDNIIEAGSVLDGFLLNSPLGPDILYEFGGNLDEAKRIAGLSPYDCAREFVKLEQSIAAKAPQPKKLTAAKPPGTSLGGTAKAPDDEVAAALASGDFGRYMELKNAQDAARFKRI